MIKPLLRVLPSLSGNVKLACNLLDYYEYRDDNNESVYEGNVRYAKLYPISSVLWNKKIDVGLLGSSFEYDIKKFYDSYFDIFYRDEFSYDRAEMVLQDKTKEFKPRNTDFEYGVKRISYEKNGNQFAFFAPIYIDNVDDIPSYFLIDVKLSNGAYNIVKHIKVNIKNNIGSRYNYLGSYIEKYVKQIDNKVVFCLPNSKQAVYYGIDVKHGGFAKCVDNAISIVYNNQNSIQNFDAMFCNGFKRNNLVMKQIIPFAFYFDLSDILTDREKYHYRNSQVYFSGRYYSSSGEKIDFYDFAVDYDEFVMPILKMDKNYGTMVWQPGNVSNIMDVSFPSLNEGSYINYQFANKMTPKFSRWKMLYSDDEYPYVMNMSWAFSKNQNSNYRYGEFPVSTYQMMGLADYKLFDDEYQYNLHFPLSVDREKFYDSYDKTLGVQYESIFNNYCLSWYSLISDYSDSIFSDSSKWRNVENDCVYYNGILYDLSNIYNLVAGEKIDKFGVFVIPNLEMLDWSEVVSLKFADNTLNREITGSIVEANVIANSSILESGLIDNNPANFLYYREGWDSSKVYSDELQFDNIFTYSYSYGDYIDLNEVLYYHSESNTYSYISFYDVNKYYDAVDIVEILSSVHKEIDEYSKSGTDDKKMLASMMLSYLDVLDNYGDYVINSYLQLPIYESISLSYDNRLVERDNELYIAYVDVLDELLDEGKITEDKYNVYIEIAKHSYMHPSDNSYVLNLPEYSNYLRDSLYYHLKGNTANEFSYSYNNGNFEFDSYRYSYMQIGAPIFVGTLYGNTLYVKHNFYKASDIENFKNPISYECLQSYCLVKRADDLKEYDISFWNYSDIYNPNNYEGGDIYHGSIAYSTAYASYLYRALNKYKNQYVLDRVESKIEDKIKENSLSEYIFNPVLQYNSEKYVSDVFTELSYNTGKYCGDLIKERYVLNDKDVLWVDEYNLNAVYRKFLPQPESGIPDFNSYNSHIFYANFLDRKHVYYYFIELFKDARCDYNEDKTYDFCNLLANDYKNNSKYMLEDNNVSNDIRIKIETSREFNDWYTDLWDTTIFIKKKVFIDKQDNDLMKTTHPVVKYIYKNIREDFIKRYKSVYSSFIEWYTMLDYDVEKNMFYYKEDEDDLFELVFTKRFMRVDSNVWNITKIENILNDPGEKDKYRDLYFYRIQSPAEWESKFKGKSFIEYVKDVTVLDSDVIIDDLDNCLIPVFDSIFAQDSKDAEIYVHAQLHKITPVWNECAGYNLDGSPISTENFRYNRNNKLFMVKITDEEKKRFNFARTYSKYENTSSVLLGKDSCVSDDLGYGNLYLNTKIGEDGTKYGFYIIKCTINNTSDSLRIYEIEDNIIISKIKYIYYINGINIYENKKYLKSIFNQVIPFTRLKPLDAMQNVNTIIYPNAYNIKLHYKQHLYNKLNESSEVDILRYNNVLKNMLLLRYMHDMTPLIRKTTMVTNQYNLKLKDVKGDLIDTGKYNSIGDSVIYPVDQYINTFRPYNVYSTSFNNDIKSYNNVVEEYIPIEYKHYNASCMIYLEPVIEIKASGKYTYNQLLAKQTSEETFNVFKNYINNTRNIKWDDTNLLFLLNKYKVEYDTVPVGLNIGKTDKLFTLTYRFKLL